MHVASRTPGRLLSLVFIAGLAIFAGFVFSVSAQTLCANGRMVGPCQANGLSSSDSLSSDNGFSLGKSLASCLISKCPIYVGVIKTVDIDKEKNVVNVGIHVREHLSQAKGDGTNDFTFLFPLQNPDDKFEFYSFNVRMEPGSELIIGELPFHKDAVFLLGDANYFSSVRSAVIFNDANDLREKFASVLGPLKDRSDDVFAGYTAVTLAQLAAANNLDEHLAVLIKLFGDTTFPSEGSLFIEDGIRAILERETDRPSVAARENAIRKMFDIGLSEVSERASRAVWVLENIAEKEWFQPKKYLNRSEAEKLLQIIHKTIGHADGPDLFEEKLSKIK
jgi:hypothetical protein